MSTNSAKDTLERELAAWHSIVGEFKALDLDINDSRFDRLISAIRLWAEHLVNLRIQQTEQQRTKAFDCAKAGRT